MDTAEAMAGDKQPAASANLAPEAPAAVEIGSDRILDQTTAQNSSSNGKSATEKSNAPLERISAAASTSDIDRNSVHERKPMAPPAPRFIRSIPADKSVTSENIQQSLESSAEAEGDRSSHSL